MTATLAKSLVRVLFLFLRVSLTRRRQRYSFCMFGPWQKRVRVRPLSVKLICLRSSRRQQLRFLGRPIWRPLMLLGVRAIAECRQYVPFRLFRMFQNLS